MGPMKTLLLALTLLPSLSLAHDYTPGSLHIQHPWTRATAPKATTAAGYLAITNHGTTPETLTAAHLQGAGHTMLHQTQTANGVATMVHMGSGIAIPAGATVTLEPGSFHIMAMQLNAPYKAGDSVPGTLTFANAGEVKVDFIVKPLATQPTAEVETHHNHH